MTSMSREPRHEGIQPPPWQQSPQEGVRLQKVLAVAGFGSRRSCEALIADGRVKVNGKIASLGARVKIKHDKVTLDDVPVVVNTDFVYYLLNKPRGVVCTASDPHHDSTILDLVPSEPRVFTIGRLDKDSEGLILLTNDGDFAHILAHPSRGVEKEYVVHVEAPESGVGLKALASLRSGVLLDDGITAAAQVSQPHPGLLRIVIHEGRNRQIRRMCAAVGHDVNRLIRVRVGNLRDSNLGPGEYRVLTTQEVFGLALLAT